MEGVTGTCVWQARRGDGSLGDTREVSADMIKRREKIGEGRFGEVRCGMVWMLDLATVVEDRGVFLFVHLRLVIISSGVMSFPEAGGSLWNSRAS